MSSGSITESDQQLIKEAVKQAEKKTSGEVKICIEDSCPTDVLDRAAFIFKKLAMHQTKERNGILIYLSVQDRKYAIIGDAGIHQHVKQEFWDQVGLEMTGYFKNGKLAEGLVFAINTAGEKLSHYFPYQRDDKNELSDDIYFGDKKS